jgi:type IV secretion system protein VirB6
MASCPALVPEAGFIRSMMAFVDCQAQSLGAAGYQSLATAGSTLALVLTGFLTLFVALFGYRLLLGYGPDLRTAVIAFVKIGFVLALATSWPAYRTLIYDVAMRGPSQLAGEIGGAAGLPGATGGLIDRLDLGDQALVALGILGEGEPPLPASAGMRQVAAAMETPAQPYPGFNSYAIGASRTLYLVAAIGGLAITRLLAGLLLAVGPFFIAFLLFENSRSLFEGWLRVLAGAALGSLATSIALATELALIEPWLADLLARRSADEWLPAMPIQLLVVTTVFALVIFALLFGAARVAAGFRLAPLWLGAPGRFAQAPGAERGRAAGAAPVAAGAPETLGRSRAEAVVDAVAATQRREAGRIGLTAAPIGGLLTDGDGARRPAPTPSYRQTADSFTPTPLGQSFPRRNRGRVSASAERRDRRA